MTTTYELMDVESGNVVGFFPTREEALAAVQEYFDRYGPEGVQDLALSEKTDRGQARLIGEGADLIGLASAFQGQPALVAGGSSV